jgi:hypothetical protein
MSSRYPAGCMSQFCGQILCDGCPDRQKLVSHYQTTGEVDAYEQRQARLRVQKAEKTGAFAFLKQFPRHEGA